MIPIRTRVLEALRVLLRPSVKTGYSLGDAEPGGVTGAPPADGIDTLQYCPVCGTGRGDVAVEFNKFVHFVRPPDEASFRADYSLCSGCGVLYAARRPVGPRYQWFLTNFEESLGRAAPGERRQGKAAISSNELTDEDRSRLRKLAARGAFVSLHHGVSRKEYLPALLDDRLAASPHVEMLGSLIDLSGARVLEVRSRLGSIAAALQRLYGAQPAAMAIFEGQQFLIGELHGMPASRIDFDRFAIPFDGTFDLIVCNHMLTHAVRPREFLQTLHSRLRPGGYAYFYNEPSDAEILDEGKSAFNTLNVFHLQTFDPPSLVRALRANRFDPVFVTVIDGLIVCLAQAAGRDLEWDPITADVFASRVSAYRNARSAALLMLPERLRSRYQGDWNALVGDALKTGVAEFRPDGRIAVKPRTAKR